MFDIGKWFDETGKRYQYTMSRATVYKIKVSFGEKSLKEWVNQTTRRTSIDWKVLLEYWSYATSYYNLKEMAVSCLGEKRCLELLKKWWGEKK